MALSEKRKGEFYILAQSIVAAFLPIAAVLSYANLGSMTTLAWSTLIACICMGAMLFYRGTLRELANIKLWKYCALVAFFIGVLLYGLYYAALTLTTPGNVAIVLLFEVFTTYAFFRMFKSETMPLSHIIGAILMVVGGGVILLKDLSGINIGDFLILLAVMFAPIGNLYQQEARKLASGEAVLFLRYLLSVPPLFILAYFFDGVSSFRDIYASFLFLLISGVLILGISKLWWIEGLHRTSVPKAIALASVAPFFTLLFAWLVLYQEPTLYQLFSLVPLIIGTLLLTDHVRFPRRISV